MTLQELLRDADPKEVAAVLWLSTCDGYKIYRRLSRETLHAVHADLVRAGQIREGGGGTSETGPAQTVAG